MRRTLYWKRLLIVGVSFLALGGVAFGVHHLQVKSQVSIYRDRADQSAAEVNGDATKRGEVIALYAKYLKFRPTDETAYQKYANLLFEQGRAAPQTLPPERVASGVEGFLRVFPAHTDERRQLAELYVKNGKLKNAREHVEMLFAVPGGAFKSDIEVLELAAECEFGMGDIGKALVHLNKAVETGKAPVRVYKRALELNYANAADPRRNANIAGLLEALLRDPRFANDLLARVAAAQFQRFLGLGELQNARDNITYALTAIPGGPDDPETLLAAAEIAVAEIRTLDQVPEKLREAGKHLRHAHKRDPKNLAVGTLLAEVLTRQNQKDEGVEILRGVAKLLTKVDSDYTMVVDRLIDLGEQTDSAAMADVIAADETRKSLGSYFRGRLALLKQDWPAAQRLLEDAGPKVAGVRVFHKKAMVGLAGCYAVVQNPDKQLEYCQKALRDDPNYPLALIGEAEALFRLGKVADALRRYRTLVNEFQLIDYRPELVRLELFDVMAQPVELEVRNWERFEASLGPVAARGAEIFVFDADSRVVRGKRDEAVKLLRDWLDTNLKDPKAAAVFVALARIQGGTIEAALSVLDQAQAKLGDRVDIRLARVGLLVLRPKPAIPADFDLLGADSAKFSKDEQFRLWYGLGSGAGRVADTQKPDEEPAKALRAAALKYLRTAADMMPKDLTCRAALLDHGLAAGAAGTAAVEQSLKEIAEVEGKDGPFGALGAIAIKLPGVQKMTDGAQRAAAVQELRELARRVRELRPGWGRVYVAIAELDMIEGLNDAALTNYTAAIDKGERQEFVIRRAVDLCRVKKQDDKAVALLNKLRTEVRLPDDLDRYRAIRDLLAAPELPKNSRPTVDSIAPADSKDYRMQLLRGSLLVTIREDADSLVAFRRAVELNDQSPETWGALVSQLLRVNKLNDANRAVVQAEKVLTAKPAANKETETERKLALGGLHEMVGDTKTALGYFTAAAVDAPLDLNAVRQLILFFQRNGRAMEAEEMLLKAKEAAATDLARWARRHLALTMISRSNAYNVRGDALALIERNLAVAANDPEDVKVRAVIWTVDPVTREDGIKVLKTYGARGDLTPDEFYLLGRLSFDQGHYGDADQWFKLAARIRPGVTAEHLAAVVRVSLALKQVNSANIALERLKLNNPNSWEAVCEEARVLNYKSKNHAALAEADEAKKLLDQARTLIQKFPNWDTGDNVPYRSGPLLEELGLIADAEAVYKKYLAANTNPGAHQPITVLYIRQKQPEKAVDLAFEREPKAPVLLTARLLTGAVRTKRPDITTEAKVEKWLEAALVKAASDPELEAALIGARAELCDARGEYDKAIKEYELALTAFGRIANPKGRNDVVVNNLCMLLALHEPKRANDAVKMMSDLIAIRGPVPSFLDTRAVAYLVSSRPEQAIKDLEMALVQYDRGTYHFHLAWAYDLNVLEAKRVLAADELKKARALGLTATDLHPIEFEKYKALLGKYKLLIE